MPTIPASPFANGQAIDATTLNNYLNAIVGVLNGHVAPGNLSSSQVHVPFNLDGSVKAGTLTMIAARPVSVSSGTIVLKSLGVSSFESAGNGTLVVQVDGYTSLANALSNTGPTLIHSFTLNPASAGSALYALETAAPTVSSIGGASFAYLRVTVAATGGATFDTVNLWGELVYTIQAV